MQFPNERLAMHECNEIFERMLETVDKLVLATWGGKGKDYDVDTPIWHRMPFGDASFAHELFKKADRTVSLVKKDTAPVYESLEQNLVDIICYTRAWLAVRYTLQALVGESRPLWPEKEEVEVQDEAEREVGKLTRPRGSQDGGASGGHTASQRDQA